HTVAFDLGEKEARTLGCIASNTGGRALAANDAASLRDALELVVVEAAKPMEVSAGPVEDLGPATVSGPAEVLAGAEFSVSWTGPENPGDYLTLVPKGAEDTDYGSVAYTRQGSPLVLTATEQPGQAEIRYVTGLSRTVLARADIRVIEAKVELQAPEEAIAGSPVQIDWKGPGNRGDYITIVPGGTPDGEYAAYQDAKENIAVKVAVPMNPGPAEVRYMSGREGRVLARKAIQIKEASVTLDGPSEAQAGSQVKVSWTGPNNRGDYVTIVMKGTPDGSYAGYQDTSFGPTLVITVPAQAGEAEMRYMSGAGGKVLARRALKLFSVGATLEAAEQAVAGSPVSITWTGPNNQGDYITIVKAGSPDSAYEQYADTSAGTTLSIRAPIEPGPAEIRYVGGQSRKVEARRPIEVVAAKIALEAVASAKAEETVTITWTGPDNNGDYLTIVPAQSPEGSYQSYAYTSYGPVLQVKVPSTPGRCEIRYVSGMGGKTLARAPIEVTP
ncbi:MAG: hypothetical protein KJT03_03795, partial [Verrucomicrobiae bacterium]|nr:hypothetical protein [Verrucomicrobiae bacterium]